MTYRGHIKNGQVTLDEPARLPEGATVNVEIVEEHTAIEHDRLEALLRQRIESGPSTPMTDADFDALHQRLGARARLAQC